MRLAILLLLLLGSVAVGVAMAQTVRNPDTAVIACARNTVTPVPVSGQFFLVQCSAAGGILVSP